MPKSSKSDSASPGVLLWVTGATVLGWFITFFWLFALVFIALGYIKRTGNEPRWFSWVLHLCLVVTLLRTLAYFYLLMLVGSTPPAITSREQFLAEYKPAAWFAINDFRFAERAIGERLQATREFTRVTPGDIDPFSGDPFLAVRDGDFIQYYSVGPDQVDQQIAETYDQTQGIFSTGDVPVAREYSPAETTSTLSSSP